MAAQIEVAIAGNSWRAVPGTVPLLRIELLRVLGVSAFTGAPQKVLVTIRIVPPAAWIPWLGISLGPSSANVSLTADRFAPCLSSRPAPSLSALLLATVLWEMWMKANWEAKIPPPFACARLELTSLVPRASPVASLNQRPPPSPLLAKLPVIFEPVIVSEGLTGDGPAPSMFMQPP